jgi:hypothetical protein
MVPQPKPVPSLKPHREFFEIRPGDDDTRWSSVPATAGRIDEIILADNFNHATRTGSRTRLARWSAGALIDQPVVHDFHEEVLVVEGDFVVGCDAKGQGGQHFGPYTFACRPPGAVHGPFISHRGCMLFEIQYYDAR